MTIYLVVKYCDYHSTTDNLIATTNKNKAWAIAETYNYKHRDYEGDGANVVEVELED